MPFIFIMASFCHIHKIVFLARECLNKLKSKVWSVSLVCLRTCILSQLITLSFKFYHSLVQLFVPLHNNFRIVYFFGFKIFQFIFLSDHRTLQLSFLIQKPISKITEIHTGLLFLKVNFCPTHVQSIFFHRQIYVFYLPKILSQSL